MEPLRLLIFTWVLDLFVSVNNLSAIYWVLFYKRLLLLMENLTFSEASVLPAHKYVKCEGNTSKLSLSIRDEYKIPQNTLHHPHKWVSSLCNKIWILTYCRLHSLESGSVCRLGSHILSALLLFAVVRTRGLSLIVVGIAEKIMKTEIFSEVLFLLS